LDSAQGEAHVNNHQKVGGGYAITGTPAFFVNGRLISAQRFETFASVIDDELAGVAPPK
jgi:protein-disulfide isomerase